VTSSGSSSVFAGFRFPREVISVAVRWYLRYGLSYRDVEELLAERGVTVDHVSIYRWVQRFTPEFIEAAHPCCQASGDRWFVNETYVKVAGEWSYLYRAVDQHGQVIYSLLSLRRDLGAARRFFTRALRAGTIPAEVTAGRAPVYPRIRDELLHRAGLPLLRESHWLPKSGPGTRPDETESGLQHQAVPPLVQDVPPELAVDLTLEQTVRTRYEAEALPELSVPAGLWARGDGCSRGLG
jgi:transposase-like protein